MTDDETRRAVAWALFAGPDASYDTEGEHVPDDGELQLADVFVESLAQRGFAVVRQP